ncbi:MAG TPA: LysM peptidoglycan-binding domain-containing protein [Candidatus Acidoferrum sp.]|nr:LysM peptidoglycan-binding domain-containing protein [Candidatus Acidoferrum sp.]
MILALVCLAGFGAGVSQAQEQKTQSVADAARQEQTRKQSERKPPAHVYTNEDLSRAQILTPADRALVEARKAECAEKKNCLPAPSQKPSGSLDANLGNKGVSLGEVARRYRREKELQALKPKQSEPFHLSIGTPALASPIAPERPEIRLPAQPVLHPKPSSHVVLRDPFSGVPYRPRVPLNGNSGIRPIAPRASRTVRPAQPKLVERHSRSPKILFAPNPSAPAPEIAAPSSRSRANLNFSLRAPKLPRSKKFVSAGAAPKIFRSPNRIVARTRAPSALTNPKLSLSLPAPVAPLAEIRPAQPATIHTAPSPLSNAKSVTVRRGDSLWKLAAENLGEGSRWPELIAANRWIANPNVIHAGERLALPLTVANNGSIPANANEAARISETQIQIHRGDTLWALAELHLGHSAAWPCLAAANPGIQNPDRIYAGETLSLPNACAPAEPGDQSSRK